jgi:hypothetical protein
MNPPTLEAEARLAKLLQYSYSAPVFCSELGCHPTICYIRVYTAKEENVEGN